MKKTDFLFLWRFLAVKSCQLVQSMTFIKIKLYKDELGQKDNSLPFISLHQIMNKGFSNCFQRHWLLPHSSQKISLNFTSLEGSPSMSQFYFTQTGFITCLLTNLVHLIQIVFRKFLIFLGRNWILWFFGLKQESSSYLLAGSGFIFSSLKERNIPSIYMKANLLLSWGVSILLKRSTKRSC